MERGNKGETGDREERRNGNERGGRGRRGKNERGKVGGMEKGGREGERDGGREGGRGDREFKSCNNKTAFRSTCQMEYYMYKLSWMLSSEVLTYSSVVIVEWQSPHMRTGISNPIGGKVDCSLEHLPHTARPHLRQWCWGGREGGGWEGMEEEGRKVGRDGGGREEGKEGTKERKGRRRKGMR